MLNREKKEGAGEKGRRREPRRGEEWGGRKALPCRTRITELPPRQRPRQGTRPSLRTEDCSAGASDSQTYSGKFCATLALSVFYWVPVLWINGPSLPTTNSDGPTTVHFPTRLAPLYQHCSKMCDNTCRPLRNGSFQWQVSTAIW